MSAFIARSAPQVCARLTGKARHAEPLPARMHSRQLDDPARKQAQARIERQIAICKWGVAAMFSGGEL